MSRLTEPGRPQGSSKRHHPKTQAQDSVGARAEEWMWGGPLWSPASCSPGSPLGGTRSHPQRRATIKALPSTPHRPIDSNKIGRGVAKGAKKKDNPFKRSLQSRKEFLLMTHDSANEQARQLPMPSLQQVEEYVLHQSQALVPVGRRRGKPATLTALHLCLGIVLCGLEGFGSQLKLWRRVSLEPGGLFAPACVV